MKRITSKDRLAASERLADFIICSGDAKKLMSQGLLRAFDTYVG